MTRKTVMHRETEVFVVEEKLAPRKEAIKRRVKLERCIAAGINLGAMILTGGRAGKDRAYGVCSDRQQNRRPGRRSFSISGTGNDVFMGPRNWSGRSKTGGRSY